MKTKSYKPKCYGILPMAGKGSRLQPIPFSKELFPVAYNNKHFAISEFSIRSMLRAKVNEIKLVIHPDKRDITNYYSSYKAPLSFYYYPAPSLPESCLFPIYGLHDQDICLFGLPDTLFSPNNAYSTIKAELETGTDLCLGLFKVKDASQFDSVTTNKDETIKLVRVKISPPISSYIWGIWGANVKTLKLLKKTINKQANKKEKLLGKGFNDLVKMNKLTIKAKKLGNNYYDIGTMYAATNIKKIIKRFKF